MSWNATFLRALVVATALLAGSAAMAHEGHDHGEEAATAPAASVPRVEAASSSFELVGLLRKGELIIYLDRFDTNGPVEGATIEVETPAGSLTASAHGDTYHLPAPWASTGAHALAFTITAGDVVDILSGTLNVTAEGSAAGSSSGWVLPLGPLKLNGSAALALVAGVAFASGLIAASVLRPRRRTVVANTVAVALIGALAVAAKPTPVAAHEGHDHGDEAPQPAGDTARRLFDGALFVPKPTQRILGIRTVPAQAADHVKTVELPGRIIPDPNASGFVQASVSGRLSAPTGGFPRLGTAVKEGDLLALVTPPLQAIDVSDMRQKAGELDQQISIVEKRITRYETLTKTGAINKVALDESILELAGLRERRASIERTRAEPERLIAPVSGVVAAANAVAGQIAETNAVVFQIVNPGKLWVEALTFRLLPDAQAATARTGEGQRLALTFQGAGLADRSQAIPVHFSIDTIDANSKGLRVGQLVTVLASTGEKAHGLSVPRTAVLRGANGQTVVFEHTSAERFEPRIVRTEPLDADRVLVLDGLAPGKRVVVQGAELLNQIR